LSIKPIVLFKSAKITDSNEFLKLFNKTITNLTGDELQRISGLTDNETLGKAYEYFKRKGISFEQLAQELREDFSEGHCISANDDKEATEKQRALNSLESASNPYRAVYR